jgi:hypothetical protein
LAAYIRSMLKILLMMVGAAALFGAAVALRQRFAAAFPEGASGASGEAPALHRLTLTQYALGALPVAAFFVLANGDLLLAVELVGVWLVMALGLVVTGAGLRRVAAGEPWIAQALSGAMLVAAGVDAGLLIAAVPWWLAALVAGAVLVGMLALLDHWPWDEAREPERARGRRRLHALRAAAADIPDAGLRGEVLALAAEAAAMLARLDGGPAARRFIGVWLRGARDATRAFVRAEGWREAEATARFRDLLATLARALEDLRAAALAADRARLDVEIEVLTERLTAAGLG